VVVPVDREAYNRAGIHRKEALGEARPVDDFSVDSMTVKEDEIVVKVRINDSFKGGHVTVTYGAELPRLQLEKSRSDFGGVGKNDTGVCGVRVKWSKYVFGMSQ
jgi:hypothetical protein